MTCTKVRHKWHSCRFITQFGDRKELDRNEERGKGTTACPVILAWSLSGHDERRLTDQAYLTLLPFVALWAISVARVLLACTILVV